MHACVARAMHACIMATMETATDLIKQLRASGLKQTEIARLTKIPQFRLSRWEAKGAPPAANDALKLVRLLGTVTAKATANDPQTTGDSPNTQETRDAA